MNHLKNNSILKRLPYLNATISEVLRIANIVPVTVNHRAITDTTLLGYKIKKDYILSANLTSVHMDKDYWGDPEIFRPERFINDQGEFIDDPWLIPFGAGNYLNSLMLNTYLTQLIITILDVSGRRRCIGEILAKHSLLLFTASLLQKFRFELASGETAPNLGLKDGFIAVPPLCKLLITERKSSNN